MLSTDPHDPSTRRWRVARSLWPRGPGLGLGDERQVDVLETRPHDLELVGRATEPGGQRRGEPERVGGALLPRHPLFVPLHDRHPCLIAAEPRDRTDRTHAPRRDDPDAIGELRGLVEVVRGEHDRGALGLQTADEVPELPARVRIEPRRRLVQEQQLGPADDAERDIDPPLLPARELRDACLRLGLQAHRRDHLVDVARVRVEPRELPQLLAHRRQTGLPGRLQHDAEPSLEIETARRRVDPEHLDVTARPTPVPLEDLDRRRLARAVRPEQRECLAPLDLERHAVDDGSVAVRLPQVVHPYRDLARTLIHLHAPSLAAAAARGQRSSAGAGIPHSVDAAAAAHRGADHVRVSARERGVGTATTRPRHPLALRRGAGAAHGCRPQAPRRAARRPTRW